MTHFESNLSRRILLRMLIAGVLLAVAVILSWDFILDFYVRNQLTNTGIIINAAIVLLFLAGVIRMVMLLVRYAREEGNLAQFVQYLEQDQYNLAENVDHDSMIHRRYANILEISKQNAPINHSALAALVQADESTRLSFPKFVNNILILAGVFGTVVGLALGLLGASDLLGASRELSGMDQVIHGMSTALNTTITAIVCFLFFGYFYLKLIDVQTNLIGGIEQVTTLYLLPKYAHHTDNMLYEVIGLVKDLREVADSMRVAQADYSEAGHRLRETVSGLTMRITTFTDETQEINRLLREGFRLPTKGI